MGLGAYLCVSAAVFALGLCCILARRNLVHVLIGTLLVLNAAAINFVAFARFHEFEGRIFALFVILIAAVEAAVALAMVFAVVRQFQTTKPSALDRLRE